MFFPLPHLAAMFLCYVCFTTLLSLCLYNIKSEIMASLWGRAYHKSAWWWLWASLSSHGLGQDSLFRTSPKEPGPVPLLANPRCHRIPIQKWC